MSYTRRSAGKWFCQRRDLRFRLAGDAQVIIMADSEAVLPSVTVEGKDGPAHGQRHYIRVMAAAEGPGYVISQRTVEAHSETNTYSTCPCRAVSSALHRNELSLSSYHHDVVTTISTSQ